MNDIQLLSLELASLLVRARRAEESYLLVSKENDELKAKVEELEKKCQPQPSEPESKAKEP